MITLSDGTKIELADTLHITTPRGVKMIGLPNGTPNSVHMQQARVVIAAAQSYSDSATSIRENNLLSAAQRDAHVKEKATGALTTIETSAKAIVGESDRLRMKANTMSPTAPYEKVGHWKPVIDLRMIDLLNAMDPVPKAAKIAMLIAEPLSDLDMADAIVRLPASLSNIGTENHSALVKAMLQRLKGDDYAALQRELQQSALARNAVRAAIDVVAEAMGSYGMTHAHAPVAMTIHREVKT